MTVLRRHLADDLKAAVKADDTCRAATLRLIIATLEDRDAAARGRGDEAEIDDAAVLDMLAGMVRQRRDSIVAYRADGRDDLAAREAEEIGHIERYMPTPLDAAEVAQAVAEVIAETGARSLKDVGRAMAVLKRRYTGRMDFAAASHLVRDRLAGGV